MLGFLITNFLSLLSCLLFLLQEFANTLYTGPDYQKRGTLDKIKGPTPLLIIMGLREDIIILTWYMGSIVCIGNLFSLWGFIQKYYLQFYFILFYCLQNCIYNVSVCKQSCLLRIIYIDNGAPSPWPKNWHQSPCAASIDVTYILTSCWQLWDARYILELRVFSNKIFSRSC